MAPDTGTSIIITNGHWMHIPYTRIHHRHYPEVRGEGQSPEDAATHLANQLAHALEWTPGHGRHEAIKRSLVDVQEFRAELSGSRPRPIAAGTGESNGAGSP